MLWLCSVWAGWPAAAGEQQLTDTVIIMYGPCANISCDGSRKYIYKQKLDSRNREREREKGQECVRIPEIVEKTEDRKN